MVVCQIPTQMNLLRRYNRLAKVFHRQKFPENFPIEVELFSILKFINLSVVLLFLFIFLNKSIILIN